MRREKERDVVVLTTTRRRRSSCYLCVYEDLGMYVCMGGSLSCLCSVVPRRLQAKTERDRSTDVER